MHPTAATMLFSAQKLGAVEVLQKPFAANERLTAVCIRQRTSQDQAASNGP
jgi:FixJ family two-component response regulator